MKTSEIIDILKKHHAPVDEDRTADVVKFGDPDQACTEIVTTVCATV